MNKGRCAGILLLTGLLTDMSYWIHVKDNSVELKMVCLGFWKVDFGHKYDWTILLYRLVERF